MNEQENKRGRPTRDGEAATGHIHVRTTLHRKSHYVRTAKPLSLAEWLTRLADKESGYEPPQQ